MYTLAGVFYGIAALLSVSRTGVGDPQAGQTENLDSITAVVLGGTQSVRRTRHRLSARLLGALIVGVFRNGLTLIGVSSVYQVLITGMLVILAVAADKLARVAVPEGASHDRHIQFQLQPRMPVLRSTRPHQALRLGDRARRRRFRTAARRDPGGDRR